jgi:hypothetical protein
MAVETANANVEDVVERRHWQRVSLSVHIGSYVYKARFCNGIAGAKMLGARTALTTIKDGGLSLNPLNNRRT